MEDQHKKLSGVERHASRRPLSSPGSSAAMDGSLAQERVWKPRGPPRPSATAWCAFSGFQFSVFWLLSSAFCVLTTDRGPSAPLPPRNLNPPVTQPRLADFTSHILDLIDSDLNRSQPVMGVRFPSPQHHILCIFSSFLTTPPLQPTLPALPIILTLGTNNLNALGGRTYRSITKNVLVRSREIKDQ